jgi:hypothetical protein
MGDDVIDVVDSMNLELRQHSREEGRMPRCSRTAGVELKRIPVDPKMMICVFGDAACKRVTVYKGLFV